MSFDLGCNFIWGSTGAMLIAFALMVMNLLRHQCMKFHTSFPYCWYLGWGWRFYCSCQQITIVFAACLCLSQSQLVSTRFICFVLFCLTTTTIVLLYCCADAAEIWILKVHTVEVGMVSMILAVQLIVVSFHWDHWVPSWHLVTLFLEMLLPISMSTSKIFMDTMSISTVASTKSIATSISSFSMP